MVYEETHGLMKELKVAYEILDHKDDSRMKNIDEEYINYIEQLLKNS